MTARPRSTMPVDDRRGPERGDVMLPTIIFLAALLLSSTILVSAAEQWEARRKAAAAAATMARAAAQADPGVIRSGTASIDPTVARRRGDQVLDALSDADGEADYRGRIVAISGDVVTAEVSTSVDYTFPVPGFPARITGTAQAEAVRGTD